MAHMFKPPEEPASALARPRFLSPTAAIKVSPLCLGAMSIGEAWTGFMGSMNKEQSFKLLDAFVENGGNFIDTANNYQDEQSETWVGEWMKERGIRDQLVIATKFTTNFQAYEVGKSIKAINFGGNSRKSLHVSIKASLAKLQTDYIDILYIHWWDWATSIEEVMDALHILIEQGKVLYLGASDLPAWVVAAGNTYAKAHGKTPFSVYQGRWSIMLRDLEREIIPMARQFGMAICPWGAIGGGKFQTKKQLEERKKANESLRGFSGAEQTPEEEKISAALEKVAGELGVDSIQAVALAYVMQKTQYVIPIVGGRKVEHLKDNIKALTIHLSDDQVKELEGVVPFELGFPCDFVGEDPHYGTNTGRTGGETYHLQWQRDGKPIGHE